MPVTIEGAVHQALVDCDGICDGVEVMPGHLRNIRCDEEHLKPAKHFKGRIILQSFLLKPGKGYFEKGNIKMLCFKCLIKYTDSQKRSSKPRAPKKDENQKDLLDMPDQNKYSGPRNVPATSAAAYRERGTQKKISDGIVVAKNLVRKFPGKTAYELLRLSETFTDIYVLRRYLTALKKDGDACNPDERKCSVVNRKTYTWRLVNE